MSSFKRRTTSKQPSLPAGTRVSPGSSSTIITSTGIPSLDDILGGGLPLSCSLLVLAPDSHSAYGELVQKYFTAQGLACGHKLCIIDDNANDVLAECMWMPGSTTPAAGPSGTADDEEDEKADEHDAKIKIAWRYEQMKQFQTTVPASNQSSEDYCRVFDLTCRIPEAVIQTAFSSGQITQIPISVSAEGPPTSRILKQLEQVLVDHSAGSSTPAPLRICIPYFGSSQWGDLSSTDICHFFFSLRGLLRRFPNACASASVPPHVCSDTWGGPGWVRKLGWLSDACMSLAAFTANPSLAAMFSSHHGFVHVHSLPAPHTLLPPSDKFSTLRGLSSSGENNLAFKCMRKRLIFETLHLDLEGGVGERRTTPSANAMVLEDATTPSHTHTTSPMKGGAVSTAGAAVQVELEAPQASTTVVSVSDDIETKVTTGLKKTKAKKKVAFMSDRPDLYDF